MDRQAIHSKRVQEKSTALHIAAEIEVFVHLILSQL